jgi:hypothetical protein
VPESAEPAVPDVDLAPAPDVDLAPAAAVAADVDPPTDPVIAALTQPMPPLPDAGTVVPDYSFTDPGHPVPRSSSWPDDDGAPTVTLTRRIPGATTMRDEHAPQPVASRRPLDPREARDLVEQFQFGVAQALADTASGSTYGDPRHGDVAPHREKDTQ